MRLRNPVALTFVLALAIPAAVYGLGDGKVRFVREQGGFDRTARLSLSGASIRIAGPVRCTKGGRARIDVTITQRATGAVARGTWTGRCTGTTRRWTVAVARAVTGRFDPGSTTACAAAAAANSKRATDATQWCRLVRLVR
jgi:hypothetical protein